MAYPKFKQKEDCAFPERRICNYCDCGNLDRCPYMKCISMGNWYCTYKKQPKSEHLCNRTIRETKQDGSCNTEKTNLNKVSNGY